MKQKHKWGLKFLKKNWTKDWRKVLFSDESYSYNQSQRNQHGLRSMGKKLFDSIIEHSQKQMLSGHITYNIFRHFHLVQGMILSTIC